MQTALLTRDELAARAQAIYERGIRQKVETEENVGQMVIIDVETGDYEIDEMGIESARRLRTRRPEAQLYGIRIGYNVAESLGGVMERTTS